MSATLPGKGGARVRAVARVIVCLLASVGLACAADRSLRISVYATAGDVNRYLVPAGGRPGVAAALKRLQVSRLFLEGRRGDEYVPPETLRELRDHLQARGFQVAGGIATVPGSRFGVRQDAKLGWLNYQAEKTRQDIARFFRENAGVFDELIVDDFYCTADTSPESEKARGARSWSEYRQDLLVSLIEPMMTDPARAVRPSVRLILKFPQWYDRFHLFGYDPARMPSAFDAIWVGTEARNPDTRRMGFVQPFESYVNFRWLSAVIGEKVKGAWFDHIDCTAQNFVDQAYQSVLAGAGELTVFHLGDLVEGQPDSGRPGHALLAGAIPELAELAEKVRGRSPRGIAFYKPPGSDAEENLYLADYLGMMGLPVVPEARYPSDARVAFLGVQAASDPTLLEKVRAHLGKGATVVLTPALLRRLGPSAEQMAGVRVSPRASPGLANAVETRTGAQAVRLATPLEIDLSLESAPRLTRMAALAARQRVPWLTRRRIGAGQLLVWNVRTFSGQDFRQADEWLLAPTKLGLPEMPQELADALRELLLAPLGFRLSAPTRVGFYLFDGAYCFYNFRDQAVQAQLNGEDLKLAPNRVLWREVGSVQRRRRGRGQ